MMGAPILQIFKLVYDPVDGTITDQTNWLGRSTNSKVENNAPRCFILRVSPMFLLVSCSFAFQYLS